MKKLTLNRRHFLLRSAQTSLLAGSATTALTQLSGCSTTENTNHPLTFNEIPHQLDHSDHVPEGYNAQVLLRWGDSLTSGEPLPYHNITAQQQSQCFGYNNDFIAFMPLSDDASDNTSSNEHSQSQNSQRGLLCVNHEYTMPHLMFSGYQEERAAELNTLPHHIDIELQACGHSIAEIALHNGQWQLQPNSPYNRRITATTPMDIVGPAAGHKRLQTKADPSGTQVLGTLGNCAGGKTPWGTVLIAEEGFMSAFSGDLNGQSTALSPELFAEIDNYKTMGFERDRNWGDHIDRFNINKEPREANRFGWMVEFDPYNPNSTPRKLTSLGRFEHEGTTVVCKPGQPLVAYTGDDDEFQCVYKFVSRDTYQPDNPENNRDLLVHGTLYAAKFHDDGRGEWLSLVYGQNGLDANNHFYSQADVMIECRAAAEIVGATKMDRPEDVETNPVNDCTYVMLTKNKKRKSPNSANMRGNNRAGHILEIVHPGHDGNRDHTQTQFTWNTFILGGDPTQTDPDLRGVYGPAVSEHGWFTNPDNLAFDHSGHMWVATDGCEDFGFHDGLWAVPTSGTHRAVPKHFFGCPKGAEICGPEFTPDGSTLFVAVQHPADAEGSSFDNPIHRWPNPSTSNTPPLPAVMAIRRQDGKPVGS